MSSLSNTQNIFDQDLSELVKVRYIPGNLFSQDNGGNEVGVRCFYKGEPNSIDGNVVSANVIRADGTTVAIPSGAIYGDDNNIALVNLTGDCYEIPGVITIIIKITGEYRTTTIGAFITNVYVSATDTVIDPGTILPSIQTLISNINTAVASIPADYSSLWTSLAPAFSTSTAYEVGQYVTNNGGLYRFTTAHTAGAWNSAHVTAINVGGELVNLKSAISNITGNTIIQFSNPALKQYINTSGDTVSWDTPSTSSATNIKWAVVECQPGDKFTINGKGGFSDRLWAFADSSKNILNKSNANVTATNLLITAPNNSAYLIINDEINKQSFIGELLVNVVEDNANQASEQIIEVKSEITQTYDILYGDINLLEFSAKSKTTSGITFVENANGTVTANGTSTANSIYEISFTPAVTGLYHLSGCPTGGSSTQYYQQINDIAGKDTGDGVEVTLTAGVNYSVWIVVISGRTVTNLEFKPTLMLKSKSISSLSNLIATLPFMAQTPPLFEGGFSAVTGKYYHDTSESWLKSRVRTNVIRIAKGATIKTSGAYQLTISKYSDYNLDNFIENIASQMAMTEWTCPADGYYTITFKLTSGGSLTIDAVKSAWDFKEFYCIPDNRIHIYWIGSGNSDETATYTDSGDCSLVVFPDGTGLLIDGANARNYTSVRRRLAEAGFYHIKNIIISHFHDDHVGGIIQMVNSDYIDISGATVYLPDYDATLWAYNNSVMSDATKTMYDNMMSVLNSESCVLVYPDTDFKPYQIGGAVLSFYNCDMEWYETHSTNYNDWSLCNYIFYGNMNINFTGDIGPIAQSHLGGTLYKTNIYKADHHGWLNQTVIPLDYINNVSPDVVIALDGQVHDQYIGTDTAPLIKWCEKYGVPYYRKYTNGEIVMAVSKDSWVFESKVKRTTLPDT